MSQFMKCFYIILLCAILSKFIQCLTDYGLRGIKANFMRHLGLALLHIVSRCPPRAVASILRLGVLNKAVPSAEGASRIEAPKAPRG